MKKYHRVFFASLFVMAGAFFACVTSPALAQLGYGMSSKPEATKDQYVAMLYYKMAGKVPDFDVWAEAARQNNAGTVSFGEVVATEDAAREMAQVFNLISYGEPVIVERLFYLPPYSQTYQGYFIDQFNNDTYFGYSFAGENFAIIPNNIETRQWLQVSPQDAAIIEQYAKKNDREIRMVMTLNPKVADKQGTVFIDDKNYWLLLAEMGSIRFYTADGSRLLWESRKQAADPSVNNMLNLYQ